MAKEQDAIKTRIEITGEKEYKDAIKDINKNLSLMGSEMKLAAAQFADNAKGVEALKAKQDILNKTYQEQVQKVKAAEQMLEKYKDQGEKGADAARNMQIELNRFATAAAKTQNELNRTNKELEEAEKAMNSLDSETGQAANGLKDVGNESKTATKGIKEIGDESDKTSQTIKKSMGIISKAIAGIGAAVSTGIGFAINAADNAKDAMNDFQAKTAWAFTSAGEKAEGFDQVMKNIYAGNYGEDFNDIADAMATVAQNADNLDPSNIEKLTKNALILRDTFGYEVNETMRAANMLMDQFGISGEAAFNLIAQGAQAGLDKNGDMLDSINEYSVHFQQLGLDAGDMFDALAAGAREGAFSIDKVGDAFKEFGIRVKDGSDSTNGAFELLGLDAVELQKKFVAGGSAAQEAYQKVADAMYSTKDSVDRNNAGLALFGTMWEDLGETVILESMAMNDGFNAMNNSLKEIDSLQYDNFKDNFTGLKRLIEMEFVLPISEKALPAMNDFVNELRVGAQQANGDISQLGNVFNTAFGGLMEQVAGAIPGIVQGIVSALPTIAETGVQIITSLATGLVESIPTLLESGAQIITGIADSFMTAIPQIIELGAQIIANIGSGLATGIPNFVNKALEMLDGFANMLTANLPKLIDAGISFVTNLAQGLANALPDFIAKAPEIISKFANLINDNMPKILAVAVNIIVTLVKGLISAIPTLVANIPKIITAIVDVWSAFNWAQLGKNAIGFLRDGITSMIGAVKTAGTNILNTVKGAIQALPGNLKTIATNAMTNFKGAISGAVTSVWNAAKGVLDSVVGVFKDAPTKLLQAGKDLITGFWNGISEMGGWIANKVSDFFGGIVDNVKALLGIHSPSTVFAEIGGNMAAGVGVGFDENMGSTTSEMQSAIGGAGALTAQEAINAVNNGIISNIGQLSGAITAIVQAVMQGLNGQAAQFNVIGQGMAKNIAVGFVGGVVQIQAVVPQMVQSIITSFTVQHQKFVNEGREIDKNIAEGMVKNVSLITSRVGQIVTPIINAFQGYAPQFRQIGVDMVNNIWEGFSSMIDDLKANIQDAIDDIKNTVNNELGDINIGTSGGGYGERENPRTRSAPQPKPEKIQITQNIYANETSYAQQQREAAKQFKLIAREVGI